MSTTDGGSSREPGAVRVDPERTDTVAASSGDAVPSRVEAEARAEQIHAEVARTEARRAEEQAARADDAVEEAERRRQDAHEAEEQARAHAAEVRDDADGAARGVSSTYVGDVRSTTRGGGNPIVFGPFTAERPELLVAAAFVGGFLLAKIIRGIAS